MYNLFPLDIRKSETSTPSHKQSASPILMRFLNFNFPLFFSPLNYSHLKSNYS